MSRIIIADYDPSYQEGIDQMMKGIELEFPIPITSPQSTRIHEVYLLPDQKFWVALLDSTVVGTIGLSLFSDGCAVVKRMMVDKNYRGKNFLTATLLLNISFEWARNKGFRHIYLGTMEQFTAAQRFYLKNGFWEITKDELPPDYVPNPIDSIYYRTELK